MLLWGSSSSNLIYPAPAATAEVVPGPASDGEGDLLIKPQHVLSEEIVLGPDPLPDILIDNTPIAPAPVEYVEQVPGPWIAPEDPPADLSILTTRAFTVKNYPNSAGVSCNPQVNAEGSGSFTVEGTAPDLEEIIGFNIGGRRIFTGRVNSLTERTYAQGEEAEQLTDVEVLGLLAEWDQVVVLPDFGARDPSILRRPAQDTRYFDWTMNGIGTTGTTAIRPGIKLGNSTSINTTESALADHFPLPDRWPDPHARWMWVADPNRIQQPRGWCYFRVPTPSKRLDTERIQFWACAYDYAEVWVDGVALLECTQPGVAQMVELPTTAFASHLVTIRAHNGGGKAGVLFSMMPVNPDTGLYYEPETPEHTASIMNSRSNWKMLPYPSQSLRLTPGVILQHLRREATWRGAAFVPGWRFTFNHLFDSAGEPWTPDLAAFSTQVGSTYLDVLKQLSEDRIDFAPANAGRVLHAWNKGTGHDGAADKTWTPGEDLMSRTTETRFSGA